MDQALEKLVIPVLQEYKMNGKDEKWYLSEKISIVISESLIEQKERIMEMILISLGRDSTDENVFKRAQTIDPTKPNILINKVQLSEITSKSMSLESYRIEIKENIVEINVAEISAILHAFYTMQQLLDRCEGCLPSGTIIDYPQLQERRLHLDMGRKFFSKEWVINRIKQLSKLKMNTLQLHFSENKGFRIECETAPGIVSQDGYLTKREIKDILEVAQKYEVRIIPSLDTPGHVEHILKSYPEYGQRGVNGQTSDVALDVTSSEAIQFIKRLYSEYMELFSGCHVFHIGGDEYMEFDRAPFTTTYKPILNDFAKETFSEGYNWKDVIVDYINQIAEHVAQGGFTPRIWNDGVFYDEAEIYEPKQKIALFSKTTVDFWSQMGWNPSVASLDVFLKRGVKEIYNVNASYFYYVLRPDQPEDGRTSHSFDFLNQDRRIFNDWMPGLFESNQLSNDDIRIGGASLAIWCDQPEIASEETVAMDIKKELQALATKSWNAKTNHYLTYEEFDQLHSR